MSKQLIAVPAEVVGMSPKKDRSWSLKFETRELKGDEVKVLADAFLGEGWLVFSANEDVETKDIPEAPASRDKKSPSSRLRSVLYVMWEQRGSIGKFDAFYEQKMEDFIEVVKSKLDPKES